MDDTEIQGLTGSGPIVPARHEFSGSVWHYTDAAGLAGIAAGGPDQTGCLWATAATMLNDPDELRYGAERVTEWFERAGNAEAGSSGAHLAIRTALSHLPERILRDPAYVVCASTDGDALGQWRGYAGAGGYAVQLDTRHEYTIVGRPDPDVTFSLAPAWVKVAYTPDEQATLIQSVFDYILDSSTVVGRLVAMDDAESASKIVEGLLAGLAAALKHPSFIEEKEVRLIAFLPPGGRPKFRGNNRGVIPYMELTTAIFANVAYPPRTFPIPIQGVRIGPPRGDAMDQRRAGVAALLRATGRGALPINGSEIPFLP
ncbi:DUF2971 domain-containing protein [Microbacterium testaceum]|uniref:DUF2971 domain-containing protein n=1 Tax=Microbacterium testaceum TaxID=2033 RepID=UPI0012AC7B3E|nr:DUF2971 domain-containing protein [Microbacterium testaceum]